VLTDLENEEPAVGWVSMFVNGRRRGWKMLTNRVYSFKCGLESKWASKKLIMSCLILNEGMAGSNNNSNDVVQIVSFFDFQLSTKANVRTK
jgi:hypothetical protein